MALMAMRRAPGVRLSFVSVFVAAFLCGAALRIEPQIVGASSQAGSSAASSADYVVINNGDESPTPQNAMARTAVDFYRAVINGQFKRAYNLSVENHWADPLHAAPRITGLQARGAFVRALDDEIGSEGLPVGIVRLAVDWERPVHVTAALRRANPELLTLAYVPAGTQVASLSEAHVSGKVVGNCAISGFSRTDFMARINGQWKVLLPGRREASDPHFEEWFLPHTHFHALLQPSGG